jgi:hypothetical protein
MCATPEEHPPGNPPSLGTPTSRPGRPLPLRLLRSLARIASLLGLALVAGCFLIAQPTMRANRPSSVTADANRLRGHVLALSETFHPRDWEHPANLDRCAEYIAGHLRRAGAAVEFQEFSAAGRTYRNVIGRFGVGKPGKFIVGAHYDAYAGTPGADDNASGVAGLLELAPLIQKHPPDAEVELVAYTLEEPPFFAGPQMGSAVHAASVAPDKARVKGVIVLEMIGYFNDAPGSQTYPLSILKAWYPDRGDFITVVGRWDQGGWIKKLKSTMKGATALPVYSFRGPESLPGVDFSDHRNYWPHGIKAAMVTNTAFYRNKAYHTTEDTADRLDYDRMGMVVVAVSEAVREIAR